MQACLGGGRVEHRLTLKLIMSGLVVPDLLLDLARDRVCCAMQESSPA